MPSARRLPAPARLWLAALALAFAVPAQAQSYALAPPRIGAGFETYVAFPNQRVIPEGVAVGLRVRAALPVNADLSVAASLGLAAHLWDGSENARWVANPQTSLIVTLPSRGSVRYIFGGFGGFLPFEGGGGAPTLHLGVGTAVPLRDTSVFFEVNPSLLVGETETTAVVAARAGVIF